MGMRLDAWRDLLSVDDRKRSDKPGGFWAICPCHADHDPSLHCYIGDDGQTVMKCHACGADRKDVAEALGYTLQDVAVDAMTGEPPERYARKAPERKAEPPKLARRPFAVGHRWKIKDIDYELTRIYEYKDAEGKVKKLKARYEGHDENGERKKTFAFQSYGADGKLYVGDLWHDLLYRLPEMLAAKAQGETILIVEGEKDANNLAALGFCAVSSAYGAGKGRLDGKWLPAYTEAISGAKRVIYIPDNDDAGEKLCAYVCEQLIGKVGELATLHLVDYLTEAERERFAKGDFTDWAHEMQAGRGWKREAIRKTFAGLLDKAVPYVRQGKVLDMGEAKAKKAAAKPAKTAESEGKPNSNSVFPRGGGGDDGGDDDRFIHYMGLHDYAIENGRLCRIMGHGKAAWAKPLCDFVPELKETITRDDGMTQDTEWIVAARTPSGRSLPDADVKNDEFLAMKWPAKVWKAYGNIYPGGLTAGYVKDALLRGGQKGAKDRTIYGYTGFKRIGDRLIYMYHDGAIGADDVSVELVNASQHYHLRLPEIKGKTEDEIEQVGAQAVAALAKGFDARIVMPLLAQAFLGPLYSTMVQSGRTPGYVVFLVGASGSFKSTLQGYIQSMFGDFHAKQMPANFRSTANWTSDAPYYCKDTLFTCDDFFQTKTRRESDELNRVANNLISAASDRAARNRQSADKQTIKGRPVRSTITMTGEILPEINEGRTLRLYVIHVERGEIAKTTDALEPYARLQRGGAYRAGMRSYIKWLMERYDSLGDELEDRMADAMREAEKMDIDPRFARLKESAAFLTMGCRMMLDWLGAVGAMSAPEIETLYAKTLAGIAENIGRQGEDIADMTPAHVYVSVIRSLIVTQAAAYVDLADTSPTPQVDGRRDYANRPVVGWRDADFYYFDAEAIDQCVRRNLKDRESSLAMSATAVRRQMMEMGMCMPGMDRGRPTPLRNKRIKDRTLKLLWIDRARIDGTGTTQEDSAPAEGFTPVDNEPLPFV